MKVFGTPDEKAVAQLEMVLSDERAVDGALMADHHLGYSMPIGGVVTYDGAISPSGVGFDIACGNKAVMTNISFRDVQHLVPAIMKEIQTRVSFGMGRTNPEPVDHPLFDNPVWAEIDGPGQPLKQKARAQLGTVGSGNHYVDLLVEDDTLWVACHFGSRGLGHTIATMFLKEAYGIAQEDKLPNKEEAAVLEIGTPAGDTYVEAMKLAGEYAYAGRDFVIQQVLDILSARSVKAVHCHHNYAWEEDGKWVVRKGATPLTDTDQAFIGGSMGDISVVVQGTGEDIGALGSAPHGAGRVMSRTQAAGKFKKETVMRKRPDGTEYPFKERRRVGGLVDWPAVQAALKEQGITVLGSGADEAPEVYKDLAEVLYAHPNIQIIHTLQPVGVVMAGADEFDPYKD